MFSTFIQLWYWAIICTVITSNFSIHGHLYHPLKSRAKTHNRKLSRSSFKTNSSNKLRPKSFWIEPTSSDPESRLNVKEIIRFHGYPVEEYDVTTKDGYILTIHRIPNGKSGPSSEPRKPVILQHGILCSSAVWVINTPDKNLAYLLADAGYDVWLTNVRGNNFGRKHINFFMSPWGRNFWDFSFDQMAEYDMPALTDFILGKTGFKQTHYIGHSMGATIPLAMLSTQPKYNNKLRSFLALAPVATYNYIRGPLGKFAPFANGIQAFFTLFGRGEFGTNSFKMKLLSHTLCISSLKSLCSNTLFAIMGQESNQFNETRLPVYMHHTPAGTSIQTVVHYLQLVKAPEMQHYDYGTFENQQRYGQLKPPVYNVSKITTPVALFWSDNDWLGNAEDVKMLAGKLKSMVLNYKVPYHGFTHIDFMWAIDAKKLLYDKILEVLEQLWP